LAWVLTEQRMAFHAKHRTNAMALEVGDELLIYTTRGCFHSPTRDAGRLMGLASVATPVHDLTEPIVFGERRYTSGCALAIHGVAALREGVELSQLVTELHVFPDARTWGMQLRRSLVPLDKHDATILRRHLTTFLEPLEYHRDAYLQIAKSHKGQHQSAATAPTSNDLSRPVKTSDLHQRPLTTFMQLVHTERIVTSATNTRPSPKSVTCLHEIQKPGTPRSLQRLSCCLYLP